jgi:chromosomal replication initiation ATPase DnaA
MREREFSFSNFAIGRANQLAYLSIKRTLKRPGIDINPLFIYSKRGLGKTHLMKAIEKDRNTENIIYFDCSENGSLGDLEGSLLILENMDSLGEKSLKGDHLYDLLNSFLNQKKQVYITSLYPPEELDISERALSVIKKGLVVPIMKPEPELVARIFIMIASEYGIRLKKSVVDFLSSLSFNNVMEIESAIRKMDLLLDAGQEITVENVRDSIGFEELVKTESGGEDMLSKDPEFSSFVEGLKEGEDRVYTEEERDKLMRQEYMQKLYIWKMKGFNVKRLEDVMDKPLETVIQTFVSFTSDVQRLIELQKRYGRLEKKISPEEREYLEKKLFDPDAFTEIESALNNIENREKIQRKYNQFLNEELRSDNFVISPYNRKVFELLRNAISDMQKEDYPIFMYGEPGSGKTHLLTIFARKMKLLHPGKIVAYIPSKYLTFEIDNISDKETRQGYIKKITDIDALFLDDIEYFGEKDAESIFTAILDNFVEKGKLMILSSGKIAEELKFGREQKDTILSGTTINLKALSKKDREIIITNLFVRNNITISDEIKTFLSQNIKGKYEDIRESIDSVIGELRNKELDLTLKNISGLIEIEEVEEGKTEELEKEAEETDIIMNVKDKSLLSHIDCRWPKLNERIFEDFGPSLSSNK